MLCCVSQVSDEIFVDLNDRHCFKQLKLSELLSESKTVLYYPKFLLQVGAEPDKGWLQSRTDSCRQHPLQHPSFQALCGARFSEFEAQLWICDGA